MHKRGTGNIIEQPRALYTRPRERYGKRAIAYDFKRRRKSPFRRADRHAALRRRATWPRFARQYDAKLGHGRFSPERPCSSVKRRLHRALAHSREIKARSRASRARNRAAAKTSAIGARREDARAASDASARRRAGYLLPTAADRRRASVIRLARCGHRRAPLDFMTLHAEPARRLAGRWRGR